MADPISTAGLSSLDQIRLAEAEITRKTVKAREASEQSLVNARSEVIQLKKQADEVGNREGQIRYKGIVSKAEDEAQALVAHAHNQAADLRRRGQTHMETGIQEAIGIILGVKGGGAR